MAMHQAQLFYFIAVFAYPTLFYRSGICASSAFLWGDIDGVQAGPLSHHGCVQTVVDFL